MPQGQSYVEKLTWKQAKKNITPICHKLAKIIDDINPDDKYALYKIRYPYGSLIINNGHLNVVTESGRAVSLNDPSVPKELPSDLSYSPVPLGVGINNGVEVFRELSDRVFSIASWEKGLDIGIWEHMGWTTPYNVSAGARSIYMIPKISLASGHKRLKRDYRITTPAPKQSFYHWKLFSQIANSPAIDIANRWHCEIIFFSKKWVEALEKNGQKDDGSGWSRLHNYLVAKI